MEPSKPVTQIGKYEVLGELGRGGMGVVYRAEDKFIGREVAIKQLLDATPELRQRFLVEARSGVLNHQNIVTVFEFGEQDSNPYIVMEFVPGDTLERILKSERQFSVVEKLEILRQVCEGIGYAHQKGVVHRDIKPANVMVQPSGQVKIVDFGIARLESSSGHTATGAVIGTFHYISPERLKGETSDGRADIWACGVMLYLMLTGKLPFAGEDISALHKVVNEAFEPLSNSLSDYPQALDYVLDRALAKNPDDRYASAEEMAADLEGINEGLKRARVGEVLTQVRGLMEESQLTTVRPMLLDLQRLDPQNTEVRRLLREVQEKLARQAKSEQLRQVVHLATEAERENKLGEALELYKQATRIDPSNAGFTTKITQIRELKEKFDKIEALKTQAREARDRHDFRSAAQLIGEAITLDASSTSLRNELAGIVQEQERAAKEESRQKLKDSGRESLGGRQFTEALKVLREALELDPTDSETQEMYQQAVAKQEEDRRRKIIDQIVTEIQDQIFRGHLEKALELIQRALDRLPGEGVLVRLKAETEKKHHAAVMQKLVEETSLRVQNLLFTAPQEALAAVQQALEKAPDEERLLALQQRVVEQLKRSNLEGLRAQYLKKAQAAVETRDFTGAIRLLETALLESGESPEVQSLLDYAREEKATAERRARAATAMRAAQELIAAGNLEGAIGSLRGALKETPDPSLEQLLRQTQEQFDEVGRRLSAVVSRIQALSESDPGGALQLLDGQPQTVQQHPQMRTLRADLEKKAEQRQVSGEAIQRAAAQLQAGKLRDGLETLEAVRRAYGELPRITQAIAEYKVKRASLATSTVSQAMAEARQAVVAQEGPRALETLRKASPAVEFVEPATQMDWKRLADEVTKAAGVKRGATEGLVVVQSSKLSPKLIAGIAAVLILAIVGAVLLRTKTPVATSYLQLNASPFAEIVKIVPEGGGAALRLRVGDHSTPMRLEAVAVGSYVVEFRSAGGVSQTKTCVVSETDHVCSSDTANLGDADIEEIERGAPQ